jgi:hypothetical protein
MEELYSLKNTDSLNRTVTLSPNSSSTVSKQKLYNTQSIIACLSLLMMFFLGNKMNGQTTTVTISTTGTGTWTVPAGVTGSITVEVWGAGGSGGGASGKNVTGSGGTGGTYVSSTFSSVVAGTTYNLYVAPQTPTGAIGSAGVNGAASWFNTAGILNANGGLAGKSANGTAVTAVTTGSIGSTIIAGGSSLSAASVFYGTAGGNGGNGGGTGGTISTSPGSNSTDSGNPGSAPGGGGGGGATGGGNCGCSTIGGSGARGEIRITYTCPVNTIANAGSNQSLTTCSTATTLAGNTPTYGTGSWTVVSGTATITTPSSPTSGVTGLAIGSTATLRWTISNSPCASTSSDMTITTTSGPGCLVYCTPTSTASTTYPISNVNFAGINQSSSASTSSSPFYQDFSNISGNVVRGNSYLFTATATGLSTNNFGIYVFFDWNNNGNFSDDGGPYTIGTYTTSTATLNANIVVPVNASIGSIRMRVVNQYNIVPVPCPSGLSSFQYEDYTINVSSSSSCTTPTAQPTALSLTPASNSISGSFTLANPVADNYLLVVSTSATPPTPVDGTTYTIGSTALGGTNIVVDTDNNNTFTASGLSASTLYYVYVFSYNSFCTGGPTYRATSPLIASTTTLDVSYCAPTGNLNCSLSDFISNVGFNTLNNTSTCSAGGYTNYSATGTQTTSLLKGSSYSFTLSVGAGTGYHGAGVWIDFNKNGSFSDAGEFFLVSNTINPSTTTTITIPIPSGAITGTTRMRVRYAYSTTVVSGSGLSCSMTGTYGETEDYTITLVSPPACVTPTAQPTTLNLTPGGTSISGTFTYANPVADSYLVVMNTTGSVPTAPVNGTTYSIGGTVAAGNIVINNQNDNSFFATGLTPNTRYYFFVYSFNSACIGAPFYNTTSPLLGNVFTIGFSFCTATSNTSTRYIDSVQTVGNLTNMTNLNTGRSASGYGNFTTLPATTQIPGGGINLDITLATSRQYLKAWVDWNNDGTLTDSGTELVYTSSGVLSIATSFGFVVPLGTAPGNYRLRLRSFEASQTFAPCGNLATGETEDYIITVVPDCPAIISTVTDNSRCESGTVNLVATATGSPTQFRWYNALTGGSLVGTSTTGSWTTPSISTTTDYFVTAFNGTCESLIRTKVIATINGSSIISMTPSIPEVCGEGNIVTITAAGDNMVDDLINENFQNGLGSLTPVIIGGAGDASTQWQSKTSTFVPTLSVWKPAISSRSINDKFAFCTSDKNLLVNTSLESANFSTLPYSNLTLTFRQYYSYYGIPLDFAYVEVSTNNGAAWTAVKTYVEDRAIATNFETVTIDLTAYINNANFKIRFRYNAQFCDGWAIDDVRLSGTKLMNTTFSWGAGSVDAYIDAACATPYTNQLVSTIYIKPTSTQLSSTSWSFTATATLSNGCPVSKDVTIYNKTKQWLGTTSNWNDANNWKPVGVPDLTNCVFIPNTSVIPGSNYNAYAKNLTVKSTGNLELPSTSNLTVADFVNVNTGGIFNIRDKASLVQINNVANTGIVNIQRTTRALSKLDYTYWSSPVAGFTLGGFSSVNSYMYSWIPTVSGNSGNWNPENNSSIMSIGKGYILRSPWGHTDGTTYTTTFTGTPNNGDITTPISKGNLSGTASTSTFDGTDENDEWNLIGNPYPSALNAATFLNLPANVPFIAGTLYLWTHNSQPNAATIDPFYGDYALNYTDNDYAVFNTTGGTATAAASTGGSIPTGYIASGQSFFVKAANTMANGTTANVTFNNNMRIAGQNGNFFKLTKNNKEEAIPKTVTDIERHRIWLNLTNNSGAFSQTLVGYVAGATQELDRSFDGESLGGNDVTFFSIIPEAELTIQGRALPFDENDQITLGYNSEINGELSIRIDHIDGLFDTQNIYLEDKELSIIHNLKENPYVFNTEKGDFNDRFVIRYTDKKLGTDTFNLSKSDEVNVIVNQNVTVQSSNELIKNIAVYDLLGRKIDSYKKVNALKYTLSHLNKTTAGLIVKITLDNDTVVSTKIIF